MMQHRIIRPTQYLAATAFIAMIITGCAADTGVKANNLRCEYLKNPTAIDEPSSPRLSWIFQAPGRDRRQSAYRILVSTKLQNLSEDDGNLWDSGKVISDKTTHIEYAGKTLRSRQQCWWKVQVWDEKGRPGAWSKPAKWTMGLLKSEDWIDSKWIGYDKARDIPREKGKLYLPPPRYLRKDFSVDKPVRRAMLYASALGIYNAYLNGQRVSDQYFNPGWTDYTRRVYYRAFDVTDMLKKGDNAIGAILADGWFAGYFGMRGGRDSYGKNIRFRGLLVLDYADGTTQSVVSDDSWRAKTGPIREADFFQGETYDARRELPGWATAGYDASGWSPVVTGGAKLRRRLPGRKWKHVQPKLEAAPHPPVRVHKIYKPKEITQPKEDMYVLDMGSNFAGFGRIRIKAPAGTRVKLRYGERVKEDGTIYTANLRGIRATDYYICRGDGWETWSPQFTFHGFQYIEVTGWEGDFNSDSVAGVEVTTDNPEAGTFECSNALVNQLQHNIVQTQRANFIDIPTDCPQRNERLGWTGDARAYIRTAIYNNDVAAFFTKWLVDLGDAQGDDGWFPKTAPSKHFGGSGGPAWSDAGVICPWNLYRAYKDKRLIMRHYDEMKKFLNYRIERANGLLPPDKYHCYGDWLNLKAHTPKDMIYTAYFARSAQLMSRMAEAIGKTEDASKYRDLYERIRDVFNREYVNEEGRVKGNTQTAYILAIMFDLVRGEHLQLAGEHLVERIKKRNWHLSTGFVGTPSLLPALTKIGRIDVAYRLFLNKTYPSWLFPVKHGATSMWERWNGWTPERGFVKGMNSFSHYSFGAVGRWMFSTIGGISTDGPGYKKITIRPRPCDELVFARTTYKSIHGKIVSNWKQNDNKLTMDVTIPANTTATVYVPSARPAEVTESGQPSGEATGVKLLRIQEDAAVFAVGSGTYHFSSVVHQKEQSSESTEQKIKSKN